MHFYDFDIMSQGALTRNFFQKPARQFSSSVTIHVRREWGNFISLLSRRDPSRFQTAPGIRLLKTKQNSIASIPFKIFSILPHKWGPIKETYPLRGDTIVAAP